MRHLIFRFNFHLYGFLCATCMHSQVVITQHSTCSPAINIYTTKTEICIQYTFIRKKKKNRNSLECAKIMFHWKEKKQETKYWWVLILQRSMMKMPLNVMIKWLKLPFRKNQFELKLNTFKMKQSIGEHFIFDSIRDCSSLPFTQNAKHQNLHINYMKLKPKCIRYTVNTPYCHSILFYHIQLNRSIIHT